MFKLVLEKAEEPEIKLATSVGSEKKQESSRKTFTSALLATQMTVDLTLCGSQQTGIRIARRNINNLRYADDATLMSESEKGLKSLLMKVKIWCC